jgi:hypothetical protein
VQRNGKVRFNSIDALLSNERACVWTLGGLLTDEQFDRLLKEPETTLRPFVINGGTVEFDMPSLIIRALKA